MRDDLFFMAMIDAAMDQPDRQTALREVFGQIHRMGQQRRYRRGYRQFLHWMRAAALARLQVEGQGTHRPTPQMLERPAWIELVIERDETRVAGLRLVPNERILVRGIRPDSYLIRFDTGSVLWEGSISENGRFVSTPEPGQPLRMAAATTEAAAPRDEIHLLNEALVLRLRPDGAAWLLEIDSLSPEV